MAVCALCLKEKTLVESHIVPKFIINWLKRTSITGHLRDPRHNNDRIQDGFKPYLLCSECEEIISKYESNFNLKLFQVFSTKYLDLSGNITQDGYLNYDEWLNKFIISISWRSFVSNFYKEYPKGLSESTITRINTLLEKWRKYLLGESNNYGNVTNYLLFLRNIHNGKGELPENISPHIIHYLMRSIDGSLIIGKNMVISMSKIGPIMLLTSITPNKTFGFPNSIVKNKGKIKIEQIWSNGTLNEYLFIQRPNELDLLRPKTEKQKKQVRIALNKSLHKAESTMTLHVIKADQEKK